METIMNYYFRDMGVLFGRTIRHIIHSMDTKFPGAIMPIAFMLLIIYVWLVLLFVYVFGIAIQTLEEILL